jgi:hypothetical protein
LFAAVELLIVNILDMAINSAALSQNEAINVLDYFMGNIRFRVAAALGGEDVPGASTINVEPRQSS